MVDVSFSGVSTQYLVDVPGAGLWTIFSQNLDVDDIVQRGDEVTLTWDPRHTFTLAGDEDLHAGVSRDVIEVTP